MTSTTHRAGDVLEELLLAGVLTVDDVASAVGAELSSEGSIDIEGDVVTVDTGT